MCNSAKSKKSLRHRRTGQSCLRSNVEGTKVYLSIGSNLNNRERNLKSAVDEIGKIKLTTVCRQSSIYETKPFECPPGTPWFLNMVIEIETNKTPIGLLKELKIIEGRLGRGLFNRKYAPRTIDIDIINYGSKVVNLPDLRIPHERYKERRFVLAPLMEIDPNISDPRTGESVREMFEKLTDECIVREF